MTKKEVPKMPINSLAKGMTFNVVKKVIVIGI